MGGWWWLLILDAMCYESLFQQKFLAETWGRQRHCFCQAAQKKWSLGTSSVLLTVFLMCLIHPEGRVWAFQVPWICHCSSPCQYCLTVKSQSSLHHACTLRAGEPMNWGWLATEPVVRWCSKDCLQAWSITKRVNVIRGSHTPPCV